MTEKAKKKSKPSPEERILRVLNNSLKLDFRSEKQVDALVTMLKSVSLFFREVGKPLQWQSKKKDASTIDVPTRKKRKRLHSIPAPARRFLEALRSLSGLRESAELSFWTSDVLAALDARFQGNLVRYLIEKNLRPWADEVLTHASKNLENVLFSGDVDSVKRVLSFCRTSFDESSVLFLDELKRIRRISLPRLPEVSRSYLTADQKVDTAPSSAQISDPSQSVEVRQLAFLLRSAWLRRQNGTVDVETFDSLMAFCKGFKNLELLGSSGDRAKYSDEFFEDQNFRPGEEVLIKVPPIVWRSGERLRVIVKGSVDQMQK